MMHVRAFVVAAFVLGVGSPARADVIFTFSGGIPTSKQHFTYGFQFTPVVNITVDSLGFFDADQDGLAAAHRVGIWTTSGTLLASTTVTNANSTLDGPVINGGRYRLTAIPGLDLDAGTTYVFGAAIEGASDVWFATGTNISNAPSLVTVSATGVFHSGDFVFPSNDFGFGYNYAAGSFTAEAQTAVPEPSSLSLLGLGVIGLAVVAWRRIKPVATPA